MRAMCWGNNPLGKAAGTGKKCTVCHSEYWVKKGVHTEKFCTGCCPFFFIVHVFHD